MHVFCDFDGTISTVDAVNFVLDRLAHPHWREIEDDWIAGRIDAAACMRAQTALISGDDAALDAVLDEVDLDPGFARFVAWCGSNGAPVTVVSDGVDYFIRRILSRQGLDWLPVISNRLEGAAGMRRLGQPHLLAGCAAGAGVCKCAAVKPAAAESVIYVGDGRSDFCVSARADLLFAKGALAIYAQERNLPYYRFDTFDDVTTTLAEFIEARRAAS